MVNFLDTFILIYIPVKTSLETLPISLLAKTKTTLMFLYSSQVYSLDISHTFLASDPMNATEGRRYRQMVSESGGSKDEMKMLQIIWVESQIRMLSTRDWGCFKRLFSSHSGFRLEILQQ